MSQESTKTSERPAPSAVRSTDWFDDDEDDSLCYDPETDCPRCGGTGRL